MGALEQPKARYPTRGINMIALTMLPNTGAAGLTRGSQVSGPHRALVCSALACLIVSGLRAIPAAAQIISVPTDTRTYSLTDLGTLGGASSAALGINGSGQVVGFATTGAGAQHAFLARYGVMQDLGTICGTYIQADGVN